MMARRERRPTAPGRILQAHYLEPRGISITKLAEATGLTRKHVSNIVNESANITPETAVRFSVALNTTPEFWMNLQNAVSIHDARAALKDVPIQELQLSA
ncbi:MAG: HigA family addiction module antitoxin [Azospirillaceae bacterium]|nr:HigA family addiction module antitoxin [Azospirillaceae bacterium]